MCFPPSTIGAVAFRPGSFMIDLTINNYYIKDPFPLQELVPVFSKIALFGGAFHLLSAAFQVFGIR